MQLTQNILEAMLNGLILVMANLLQDGVTKKYLVHVRVQNVEANGHLKLQKQGQLTPINTNNCFIYKSREKCFHCISGFIII